MAGKRDPMPQDAGLMLGQLADEAFNNKEWIFEPKLDGLRVLCRFDGKAWSLVSRNGKPQDFQFPEIMEGLRNATRQSIIIDGEIVCLDEHGKSSFRKLQQRFHVLDAEVIAARRKEFPAYLFAFDVLYAKGKDVRGFSLAKRKEILATAMKWSDTIRLLKGTKGKGINLFQKICATGGEGIVAKLLSSPYVPARTGEWLKIKCSGRQEFVIAGFTEPQRSRVGLGALLVGYYEGKDLLYAGKVGTGFTRDVLLDLRARLEGLEQKNNPFRNSAVPKGKVVHWVKPKLVAEIAYAEWTQNGCLRQPKFEGLREDKDAKVVVREKPRHLRSRNSSVGVSARFSTDGL
jgi:bifunctional non-homologous end joining protein LigD